MKIEELTKQAISGEYISHGNIQEGDCIIGFSFGYRENDGEIKPGLSNEDLANYIKELTLEKPLLLQFEIADALKNSHSKIYRISKHREEGAYLDTSEVAKQALEIMKKHHWNTAIIIAHPSHLPRVDAVCQKLGINTIAPQGLETIRFDQNSVQEWTRNKEAWNKREKEAINLSVKYGLI